MGASSRRAEAKAAPAVPSPARSCEPWPSSGGATTGGGRGAVALDAGRGCSRRRRRGLGWERRKGGGIGKRGQFCDFTQILMTCKLQPS